MKNLSKTLLVSVYLLSLVSNTVSQLGGGACTNCRPSSLGTGTYPVLPGSNYGIDSYTNVGSSLGSGYGMGSGYAGDSLSSGGFGNSLSSGSSLSSGNYLSSGNSLSSGSYLNSGSSLSSGSGMGSGSYLTSGSSSGVGSGSYLTTGGSSLSSGYGGFDLNSVIGGINSAGSQNMGGYTTNLGSLPIGTGVGLNTTGLTLGSMNPIGDASFILNTPSLTGTTFTNTQFMNTGVSNPGTITAITQIPTVQPQQTITTITGIPSIPVTSEQAITSIKVKDETGRIIQVNGYDPTRTTQAVVVTNPIENFHLFKRVSSVSVNNDGIVRDTLNEGESMSEGEYLRSSNKAYYAVLQRDGNFVVYCSRVWIARNSLWSSQTANKGETGGRRLTLTNTGNVVLYSTNINNQIWATNSTGGSGPFLFIMQGDGNLVLYDRNKNVKWQTGTVRA